MVISDEEKATHVPTVFLVDDDPAIRMGMKRLFESMDQAYECFESAASFLDHYDRQVPGCLIVDLMMPGMTGLDLQNRLHEEGVEIPVIFITGHGDVPAAVEALKAGAIDFIQKPFSDEELIRIVEHAKAIDAEQRRMTKEIRGIEEAFLTLSRREREVIGLLADGKATKEIADILFLSPRTVDLHRAAIKRKMGARSVAHLNQMILSLARHRPNLFDKA